MLYRILKTLLPFLAVAAVSVAGPAYAGEKAQPCPGAITEKEAVQIAWGLAAEEAEKYESLDVTAIWWNARWTVFMDVEDDRGADVAVVSVSADGRVTNCNMEPCWQLPELDALACKAGYRHAVDESTVIRAVEDFLGQHGFRRTPDGQHSAGWNNAHWVVWFDPFPGIFDKEFRVYISPDGSQAEMPGLWDDPSDDSFLYREPLWRKIGGTVHKRTVP